MDRIAKIERATKAYIYGYGNLSRNVFNKLKILYPSKIDGFVVTEHNNKSKYAKDTLLKNIETIDDFLLSKRERLNRDEEGEGEQFIFIIAVNPIYNDSIISSLHKKKLSNFIIYSPDLDTIINNKLEGNIPKIEVSFLSITVGQACNYKCKDCANFAPYAKKENLRYSLMNIKSDIDKVLPHFEQIDKLHIQGGEPFLYTDLPRLLLYINQTYKKSVGVIQIATNGSIVPKEELLEIMAKTNVLVRISNYPVKSQLTTLRAQLDKYNIKHSIYNFANGTGEWSSSGGLDYVAPKDEVLLQKVHQCKWSSCYTIENGWIGRCARSIPAITLQNINIHEGDYII